MMIDHHEGMFVMADTAVKKARSIGNSVST
jgi:uncharacterized protein (DUF305 family)